jgi:hypothetical protein
MHLANLTHSGTSTAAAIELGPNSSWLARTWSRFDETVSAEI